MEAPKEKAVKFSEVWALYLEGEAKTKAPQTVVKHKRVWKNHIKDVFADRYISGSEAVSVQEINNFLSSKYYSSDLSFGYVEAFLKVFYVLYGQAYRHDIITLDTLHKFTEDKTSKISMPPKTAEDVDLYNKTITVNKQLIYVNGCWCISRVKTLTSNRVIDISDDLCEFLLERRLQTGRARSKQGFKNRANEIVLDIRG